MVFEIKGKVGIITGGASGIGLEYAKELLRHEAKAVTLADVSEEFAVQALKEIEEEFGAGKSIFVKTDVTNIKEFEDAFIKTIEKFQNVDILFNNAGILNDAVWEKEIAININGTVNGTLLGMDKYLSKYKQGDEALIVNVSSIAGTNQAFITIPVYSATKHAVIGLTNCWGVPVHYEATKVRVVAMCPGVTWTPLIWDMAGRNFGGRYEEIFQNIKDKFPVQKPDFLAKEAMNVVQYAPNGTFWVIEQGEPAYQYSLPDRTLMKNNLLKH